MKLGIGSIKDYFEPFTRFIKRFHTIIFFLIISIGLFGAITVLLSIIDLSAQTASVSSESISGTFDQSTIDRVNSLQNQTPAIAGKRPSPFIEP
jgi:hypothetical protein